MNARLINLACPIRLQSLPKSSPRDERIHLTNWKQSGTIKFFNKA